MKKVYLVHESGKKYGPFEYRQETAELLDRIVIDKYVYEKLSLFAYIGFRIEEALPEKITITKKALDEWLVYYISQKNFDFDTHPTINEIETDHYSFKELCKIAECEK